MDLVFAKLQPFYAVTFCGGVERPKQDLHSCTLVCREWVPLATSHLFRKVGYSFVYNLKTLQAHRLRPAGNSRPGLPRARWTAPGVVRDPESCIPTKSLDQFRQFLAVSPHILPSIRTLVLEGYPLSVRSDEEWKTGPEVLVSIVNMLPNLQSLKLLDFAVAPLTKSVAMSTLVDRPLRTVSVEYSSAESGQQNVLHPYTQMDVFEVLKCFSEVENVEVHLSGSGPLGGFGIFGEDESGEGEGDPSGEEGDQGDDPEVSVVARRLRKSLHFRPPMHLRPHSLVLAGENQSPKKLLEALCKHPEVLASIRRLRVFDPWPSMVRCVSWFLQQTKGVMPLEHLEISSFLTALLDGERSYSLHRPR